MTLQEAEAFFKSYNGQKFHMLRENPAKYDEFQNMNLLDSVQEQWRQELLEEQFQTLFVDLSAVWIRHGQIIELIRSTKTKKEENCRKLLNRMLLMPELDKKQKILIIENMAGRAKTQEDGGCCLIGGCSDLTLEMRSIMNQFLDFTCDSEDDLNQMGWFDIRARYWEAVASYEQACQRFCQ